MVKTIQDEIRQTKPFARRSDEALVSILRTATVLEHAQNEALKPHGITVTQYNVLRMLRGAAPAGLCGRDIAERLISKVPDVSRLLDRMEESGLVSRTRDVADRRHVSARITAKGRRVLSQATPGLAALTRARLERLPPRALASLVQALAVVREPI
ncbi:MAG TPA: MarR family transcriptional regulator [Gemmatimonadaceae bacterium]|jgi:DNA-binding MarR family transcriptional regulator